MTALMKVQFQIWTERGFVACLESDAVEADDRWYCSHQCLSKHKQMDVPG